MAAQKKYPDELRDGVRGGAGRAAHSGVVERDDPPGGGQRVD